MTRAGAATECRPACAARVGRVAPITRRLAPCGAPSHYRRPLASIAHHLDHQPLRAPAIELAVEDRLPRAEVEAPLGDRQDHLVVDQQVLEVSVPVVLAAPVV